MSPSQTNLFPVLNQGLFSTNFLATKFLDFSIWNDTPGLLERTSQARELILALLANRTNALRLERELDELILKIYKLTPDEIALLRQTAPPRSPLNVLETELKSK